ncbi:MAG: GNAT family N-acetyltransferase [Acidobacteria bacterium]|nr:GNAT family N-acetyltransferase [Acidobacteriota bacterium]
MELGLVRDSEHAEVDALVQDSGLPLDDIDHCRGTQFVARSDGKIVATAALEIRGDDAVLRSVAVAKDRRGEHLGDQIVTYAVQEAKRLHLHGLYLLTETAEGFFPRFGFVEEPRDAAPAEIQESVEYCHVCGSHAIAMALRLEDQQ